MEKDVAFSMRMKREIREALKEAAKKDHRSVSSLLDKIIADYLTKEGFLKGPQVGAEKRTFARKTVTVPATTFLEREQREEAHSCVVIDISMGGISVTYPKGPELRFTTVGDMPRFKINFKIPPADEEVWFDCNTCHMRHTDKETRVGASFSNPPGDYMQRLSKYIM